MNYQVIMKELRKRRKKVHVTKKEYEAVIQAMKTNDWSEVFQTKLYIKYGGEYCELQYVIYVYGEKYGCPVKRETAA